MKMKDILSQVKVVEVKDETYGPWDWSKNSMAVVAANSSYEGAVLWWVGGHLDFEICEGGLSALGDLGLDDAPFGISIWEGTFDYDNGYQGDDFSSESNGEFRLPTKEEWGYIKENQSPWDANDWMKEEHMQVSIGRIVHYCPTAEQADLWTKEGNPVTVESVLAALVVQTWEEDKANLRVFLDGGATPWVTSAEKCAEGTESGKWNWPPRV